MYGPSAPHDVADPVMVHRWETLTFLHWSFDPEVVQRLLPPWLEVETFDGAAWVGLVPFFMRVDLPRGPSVPWLSRFCETNVRTYVRDPAGTTGIWFFSLDAARLAAVVTARATYRLPYFWSRMRLDHDGGAVSYRCSRIWPGPRAGDSRVVVRVGRPYDPAELGELDHFLTARWVLFSGAGQRHRLARAWHAPWPLHQADVVEVDDLLVRAAGLPPVEGAPLAHYSPGVQVRIGRPERVPSLRG